MAMSDRSSTARPLPVPATRLARLGQLSSMTASVAGNMAVNSLTQLGQGQRPSMRNLLLTPRNIGRVADQLAKMRGAAMKIGQLVSMDTGEVLPPELATIMARLRDDAHFMPPAQLKSVLAENWRPGWLQSFQKFDVRPIAAASIGQVHRAQLKDGRDLAIKVQYPGVAQSIDSDVANVGALMRMSGLLPKGFELAPYLEEARKQLHEETDYTREGAQLAAFGTLLQHEPDFVVPELEPEWSTRNILAMSYVTGRPIENVASEPQDIRDRIARRMIELTLKEMFVYKQMQTDPNFANYLYDPQEYRVILLDFGAARKLDPTVTEQYRKLLRAGLSGETDAIRDVALDIGFFASDTAPEHSARIVKMIDLVFSALRAAPIYDFSDTELSQKMQAEGAALAEGGFAPPPLPIDVLLLQRKLGGTFLLAARLGARVEVADLFHKFIEQSSS